MNKLDNILRIFREVKHTLFGNNTRIVLTSWISLVFTVALFISFIHRQYDLVQFFGGMIASIGGVYTTARTLSKKFDNNKKENNDTN